MRNRTMALLAAAICAAGSAGAQESSARPVIRTETRVVLVDTVVTDKKGNYVRDLSAKDFRVWEDNKEQTITSVSFQAEPATPAQRKGYMILLFDNATLDANNQMQAKQAASRLFEMEGAEDRATAIAAFAGTFQILQNFTSDGPLRRIHVQPQESSRAWCLSGPPNHRPGGGTPQTPFDGDKN